MRQQGSLRIETESRLNEHDTITCAHCNQVYIVPHRHEESQARPPAQFCFQCKDAICPSCVGKDCVPFMRRVDAVEKKQAHGRHLMRLLAGEKV